MLPTTPLHLLLLEGSPNDATPPFDFLVMTSGNQSSEPICISNDEARERLTGIADGFLMHDREINLRNDDSLVIEQAGGLQIWRRSRGYAPNPIFADPPLQHRVLGMGAELKNAIALGFEDQVVCSPHIGDLSTPEAMDAHERVCGELPTFLSRQPDCIALDLHPDMHCTRHGNTLADRLGVPTIAVQHHHAHAMACLAENGRRKGLALVFDGTGLGSDGTIWGAELLHVDGSRYKRLATFSPVPLPGGDHAVYEPIRQAVARWHAAGITPPGEVLERCGISEEQAAVWAQQCDRGINAPLTHAAGRLFDAIAAILGFTPTRTSYEGQAPIRLEAAALQSATEATLPFATTKQDGLLSVDWSPAVAAITKDHAGLWRSADAARQVHRAICDASLAMIDYGIEQTGEKAVALSGGVFMNRLLTRMLSDALVSRNVDVLRHRQVPPNDGGIAFGQVVIAGSMPQQEAK